VDELVEAVRQLKADAPDATAKEIHGMLLAQGAHDIELGQVKRAARACTKGAVKDLPTLANKRIVRLHDLPPEIAHLNGEHADEAASISDAESAELARAGCLKVRTRLSMVEVSVPLASMTDVNDADASVTLYSTADFAVVDVPGRGRGMRARRQIQKGEVVLREEPLSSSFDLATVGSTDPVLSTLLPQLEPFQELDTFPPDAVIILDQILERVAQLEYDGLPAAKQARWMSLHDAFSPPPTKRPVHVFKTNAYNHNETSGGRLYELLSRANHSCAPNLSRAFMGETVIVTAQRKVAKGAELFTCYIEQDVKKCTEYRRMLLKAKYNFVCQCERCGSA